VARISHNSMNSTPARDWNEREEKVAAVVDVLRYITAPPRPMKHEEVARRCVENDMYARLLFEEVGKVDVPDHARVVFLPSSQYGLKENGPLIIEMPPENLQISATPADLANYALSGHNAAAPSRPKREWSSVDDKSAAIADVLRYIFTQPRKVRARCLRDDAYSAELFRDPRIGNINVPAETKAMFMHTGEREREIRGSLVIVVPPASMAKASDDDLLDYVLCCYPLW
jgi:hypothetical protein